MFNEASFREILVLSAGLYNQLAGFYMMVTLALNELNILVNDMIDLLYYVISTSNHMFGRAIWDKLPECMFENFEISKFSKITRLIYPKNHLNQTRDYWLITPTQLTLCIETIESFTSGQLLINERAITK